MKHNLGVDFGSTYTMLSTYDELDDRVNPFLVEGGSPYIPSIACLDSRGRNLLFGETAKGELGANPSLHAYRAFKMLLPENDPATLASHGYTGANSPKSVAREFLTHYITSVAYEEEIDHFDNVVICVPEIWTRKLATMSGRAILRDICEEMTLDGRKLINNVKIVTEPAAASAYYAYNYRKRTGSNYIGKILVIDYGGGTLDISLADVKNCAQPDCPNAMEIDILERTGAGENHTRRIGNAGLAYMEEVVRVALQAAGHQNISMDGKFHQSVIALERYLTNRVNARKLSDLVKIKARRNLAKLADENGEFCCIKYGTQVISITYSMLYTAYAAVIQPVLKEQLEVVTKDFLNPRHINPLAQTDTFKIAVVGGFGQFALVQTQIRQYFGISNSDLDITVGAAAGKQDAISYGAALIASGVITMSKTSKYSIGLRVSRNGQKTFNLAIKYRQPIDYSEIYHIGYPNEWEPIVYGGPASDENNKPWIFAINEGNDLKKAYEMVPLPEKRAQLDAIDQGLYFIGFSVDESDFYTFYAFPRDPETGKRIETPAAHLSLGNFTDIFGLAALSEKHALYAIDEP